MNISFMVFPSKFSSCHHPMYELAITGHVAFYQTRGFNDEKEAIAGSG